MQFLCPIALSVYKKEDASLKDIRVQIQQLFTSTERSVVTQGLELLSALVDTEPSLWDTVIGEVSLDDKGKIQYSKALSYPLRAHIV